MADVRQKLVGLLDYVEQVVRLDERVAFRLSEFHLPDGSTFAITRSDTIALPAVRHDHRDEEGPVWLEVERLARVEPPVPPVELSDWIVVSPDPARQPVLRPERIVTVTAAERDIALSEGRVRPEDVLEAPRKRGESENSPKRFDLKLRLEDHPALVEAIGIWISGIWHPWSVAELPRRQTMALYQVLYKIFQLMEVGAAESSIELMWGIGAVNWTKDGRVLDRPLLERRVEIELDDYRGGIIRIRPTGAEALFDLKPYEELGCNNLPSLADLIRREIQRAGENEGVSPFARDSFEQILTAASVRLDPAGIYCADGDVPDDGASRLVVTDKWVLFARPRSQHVVLQDIDRLRRSAEKGGQQIGGLAERLVTQPSHEVEDDGWQPLGARIGQSGSSAQGTTSEAETLGDVFFPKPFNDDQLEIVKRLSRFDGLVVQGPPGTGKTHTIANLLCHAMASGQRVLVVSRGEAALSVLREQLPPEVRPLAISLLSNEREGLRQVEGAIREIQSFVEGTQPESRRSIIARLERELEGLRRRIQLIDLDLEGIASVHLTKLGPRNRTPAELAQRIVRERLAYAWFTDRPSKFAQDAGLSDDLIFGLYEARRRCGALLDHFDTSVPSSSDLPSIEEISRCHDDLIAAAEHATEATKGPVRVLRVTPENTSKALEIATLLEAVAQAYDHCDQSPWLDPYRSAALNGRADPWLEQLRERIGEWQRVGEERSTLMRRAVEIPPGLLESPDARAAVARAASGERMWPLVSFGRGDAKALVAGILVDGSPVGENDLSAWKHVESVLANLVRFREAAARWKTFAQEVGAPHDASTKTTIALAGEILRTCDNMRRQRSIFSSIIGDAYSIGDIAERPDLCRLLANQLRAAAGAARLAIAQAVRERALSSFPGNDRSSELARKVLSEAVGDEGIETEKIANAWSGILGRLDRLKALSFDFQTVANATDLITAAGAPSWASRLRNEVAADDEEISSPNWRDAWDHGASESKLDQIDARQRLGRLAKEREDADKQCRKLFGEIVRERTFYALERRLSPAIKAALVEFVRALARIGRGTGKTAWTHRKTARVFAVSTPETN